MTTADWIKRRRELLDAATEAPWTPEDVYGLVAPTKIDGYTHPVERVKAIRQGAADDALIADARTSLPLALDALEAVLALHSQSSYLTYCRADGEKYPCPTVDAIDTALAGGCRECRQVDGHKLDCAERSGS